MMSGKISTLLVLLFFFSTLHCNEESLEELELGLRTVQEESFYEPDTILLKFSANVDANEFGLRYGLSFTGVKMGDHHLFTVRKPHLIEEMVSSISTARNVDDVRRTPQFINRKNRDVSTSDYSLYQNPLYRFQWHLKNTGNNAPKKDEDVKAYKAWSSNYTGAGITIAVVDDGVDLSHPDFQEKIVSLYSKDYLTGSSDPSHKTLLDMQGTSVAGLIAAANNDACGLGVAYDASLVIRRVASGNEVRFSTLVDALRENNNNIDIFSNSWTDVNPYVDYDKMYGMTDVLYATAVSGRSGLGSLIVQAAGNGKQYQRLTSETVFSSNPSTIVVGAVNDLGVATEYSTPGASVFTSSYSGEYGHKSLFTTDIRGNAGNSPGDCTDYSGSAGSTAVATGAMALILQGFGNKISFRDLSWILALSSQLTDPTNPSWQVNGAGFAVSHQYGFGKIDVEKAIALGCLWQAVPMRHMIIVDSIEVQEANKDIPSTSIPTPWSVTIPVSRSLIVEHVELFVNINTSRRGDLSITLKSPQGSYSYLKASKLSDSGKNLAWTYTSVMHWGERSEGNWTLFITDNRPQSAPGTVNSWSLFIRGPESLPIGNPTPSSSFNSTLTKGSCSSSSTTRASCVDKNVASCVCERDAYCCLFAWDAACVRKSILFGCNTDA